MNFLEMNMEILECARYGEEDDLRALLQAGADVNYADVGGSTALHKAAANGEDACLKVLHEFGAKYTKNGQGNTPAHWAAQNGKTGALKFIIENFEVDVLAKNDLGRSILTEAFQSKNTDCIEICLSHDSASEERLISPDSKKPAESTTTTESNTKMDTTETENNESSGLDEANAVTHMMQFGENVQVKVRELPITRADNPFGSETAPEDDTTGLSVWPASILLGQWVAQLATQHKVDYSDKVVLELGAGCGLPAIVAAHALRPKVTYVTDIHEPTLINAVHNVRLNADSALEAHEGKMQNPNLYCAATITHTTTPTTNTTQQQALHTTSVQVLNMNWVDTTTYPAEKVDLLLGSDLVYDASILAVLIPAICSTLSADGSLLYVAPDTGRQGMAQLEHALSRVGIHCVERFSAPDEFYANPLRGVESDEFVLHFYDLSAKQPHTMYHFKWQQVQQASTENAEDTAMDT